MTTIVSETNCSEEGGGAQKWMETERSKRKISRVKGTVGKVRSYRKKMTN